ncbi:histone acetyltransferase subunit NuA4-domain-containing protein [Bisporella sp. PMI_857]|nr:histone acetyltransferase subunit NuA4-domain-containing protein [Bisporella sp. PMI_857]
MGENATQPPSGDQPGQAFYERARKELAASLNRRAQLEAKIAATDDRIYEKETIYLDETPTGNIMMGFDNYTKGTGAAGVSRRRGPIEQLRIFSNSSVSFRQNAESPVASSQSTPANTAPTPVSTSFVKADSASNHATPTSTTSANRTATGSKRSKKATGDDSETDTKETKKARTNSTAPRK